MLKMRMPKTTTEYQLNAAAIDAVSGQVQTVLEAVGMEKRNIQRLRLSMEEILLCCSNTI